MLKFIGKLILKYWGFTIHGFFSNEIKKTIVIVAPHTSNWDFVIGVSAKYALGIKANYIGKKSLFYFPYGFLFRYLGGAPVDRSKSSNQVQQIVDIFNSRDRFILGLSPEGTRGKTRVIKTGFYHIAHMAKVPIIMMRLDFKEREIEFSEPFVTTGNMESDFTKIKSFFDGAIGYKPLQAFEF